MRICFFRLNFSPESENKRNFCTGNRVIENIRNKGYLTLVYKKKNLCKIIQGQISLEYLISTKLTVCT